MLSRRKLLVKFSQLFLSTSAYPWVFGGISQAWAQIRQALPKGFPKAEIANMDPAQIDNRNLEVDRLDQFGTMGPTDVAIDVNGYRLKVTGEVNHPLSLRYEEAMNLPRSTEEVLLICPGFFANNGRWTGISLKELVKDAQPKESAVFIDVKGYGKETRVPMEDLRRKKVLLACLVNGEPLPRKHGFPFRLVYEGAYGSDWVKYVDEIVLSPKPKADS